MFPLFNVTAVVSAALALQAEGGSQRDEVAAAAADEETSCVRADRRDTSDVPDASCRAVAKSILTSNSARRLMRFMLCVLSC